jgi:hypothetical protein
MWPIRDASELTGSARRAEAVARALGWPPKEANALSRVVLELGGKVLQHFGSGMCRLEAGATTADVIVEDLGGERGRARVAFTLTPDNALAATG